MAEHFSLGMALIFLCGIFNGCFPLPMKYTRQWEWENTWLVFAVVTVGLFPWVMAKAFVPDLAGVYRGLPASALLLPIMFGLLWGIGQTMLGVSIRLAGMAFAFAVMSGVACVSGSLVPLVALNPGDILRPRGIMLMISIPVLLVGLYLYALAGRGRENEQKGSAAPVAQASFVVGLVVSILTGIFGSGFNLGFAFAGPILARGLEHGATQLTSTYAAQALVLGVGFLPNLLYCCYLLWKRRTLHLYSRPGSARNALLAAASGFLWLGGIYGYGFGATLVGRYGTSLGWALFIASSILTANFAGIFAGEWRNTSRRTRRVLIAGLVAILISALVLSLGGLIP